MAFSKQPSSLSRRAFTKNTVAALSSLSVAPLAGSLSAAASRGKSVKKGFGCVARDDGKWLEKIEALRANWFYSWGSKKPEGVPAGVEFAPMIWGKGGSARSETLNRIKRQGMAGDVKALMGFNEPDQHDQSNMTVNEALDAWPELMKLGLPLASPGCVHPDREWMIEFMRGVETRKLRVDFVCVHSYGGPSATALLARLQKVYQMFGRPLWITEFAVGDWNAKSVAQNKHSPERIARFMREVLPMLRAAKFVDRYAWFSAKQDNRALGTSALFDASGKLTELGEIYRSF